MTLQERLWLQGEEAWRCLLGWIPGGPGALLRRLLYGPFFQAGGSGLRTGVGVVIQGFRHISLGRHVGLNRHSSLYAARGRIRLGNRVFLGDFSSINANDAEISIGDNVAIGPMVLIQGANHVFDRLDLPIADQGHAPSRVIIEDNVWIAARATILPGVRIHSGAVVAAGAVVTRDVPADCVVAGVPARVLRPRGLPAPRLPERP
ncbi:MAG: acyltransferase [Desulfovibrio sp.]|jgi:galactoside O-acetyltransferase|nr:acyltransferase [Desulfovibrio sp.]